MVVDYIDSDSPPPSELKAAFLSKQWNTLPESGGMYEQDYDLLMKMTTLYNIYQSVAKLRSMDGEQIHQLTDADRKIIGSLRKQGIL